jgi:hypothetical protein
MASERIVYVDAKTGETLGVEKSRRKPLTPAQVERVRAMQARIDADLAPKYGLPVPGRKA